MSKFSENVKLLLEERSITQKQLSQLSDVSEASLCRYLTKGIQPRMDVVSNVAKALGVSSEFLLGGEGRKAKCDPYIETRNIVTRNRSQLSMDQKAEILKILFDK